MTQTIRYGDGASLNLDLPSDKVLAAYTGVGGDPLDDPAAAVAAAVSDPIDFPPLNRATVPGDRTVLALDEGIPQVAEVVAGVVYTLLEGTTRPHDITLVVSQGNGDEVTSGLEGRIKEAIRVVQHDPDDRTKLSYLAASKEGIPIYLNREICDADVVIPISTLRLDKVVGYHGVHGGLYPGFSDRKTLQRFLAPGSLDWEAHRRRRREEVSEAAWLLGVQFTIQIAPGPDSTILHVLAGDSMQVENEGRRLCESTWRRKTPARAELVVASIGGGAEQQTWDNFARALFSASQAVVDGGAIVLCTRLQRDPGPALQHLSDSSSEKQAIHEIRRDRSFDAVSASILADVLQRNRVYLLSDLEQETVEDLGVGSVTDAAEIERLSQEFSTCILVENAQHTVLETCEFVES